MNLFKSLKNRKGAIGAIGAISVGLIILILAFAIASVSFVKPALANTHVSTITVTPNVVEGGINQNFIAHVECTSNGGTLNDVIHEVRIYEHFEFTDILCQPVDGWYGPFPGENQYGKFCLWTAKAGHELDVGDSEDFPFSATTPETECCRTWLMETRDKNNYWIFNYPNICIDTTPPLTTKTFDGPQKTDGLVEWIDGVTKVVLTARDDVGPHDAGIDKTWYLNVIDETENACLHPEKYCEPIRIDYPIGCINAMQEYCTKEKVYKPYTKEWYDCVEFYAYDECSFGDGSWKLYREPFTKDQSCHKLYYFSVDGVNNIEQMKVNCFFVDKTPPYMNKDNGDAIPGDGEELFKTPENPTGAFNWITSKMPITFTCDDTYGGDTRTSPHPSEGEQLCFKVSYDYSDWGYITNKYCDYYKGKMNKDEYCCVPVNKDKNFVFNFQEESMHNLEYYCIDAVEKKTKPEIQYYKVDDSAPSITKTMIGEDHLGDCPPGPTPTEPCYVRDDGKNGVHIDVIDEGDICHVDQTRCLYNLWWFTDETTCKSKYGDKAWDGFKCLVEEGKFNEEGRNIFFHEDSKHVLYINCKDALGNLMPEDIEEFLVDSTPPVTTKTIGEPKKIEPFCYSACEDRCTDGDLDTKCLDACIHQNCIWWINSSTPITLSTNDAKVGVDKVWYKDRVLLGEAQKACQNPEEFCKPKLLEDCMYCQSGNYPRECIDSKQEYCTKEMGYEPYTEDWYDCVEKEAWDPITGCCGGWDWTLYRDEPIFKPEESCHVLYYFGVDKLGNVEPINVNCFYVDNTPPKRIKEVGKPNVPGGKESVTIHKTVTTGEMAVAAPEIYLLADTTGSMSGPLGQVKANMITILGSVDAKFGAGKYRDFPYDSYKFQNAQSITDNDALVTAAIDAMFAGGGSDGSEAQLYALHRIAQNDVGFSGDATKIVVWFGDAPGHDPICTAISKEGSDITEASVTTELTDKGIIVIAISTTTGYTDGLDDNPTYSAGDYSGYCTIDGSSGQASRIAAATGGVHLKDVDASEITDAIIDAIGEVTAKTDVVPDASDCDAKGLDVTFEPLKHVDVGPLTPVEFDETLELADGTPSDKEIICDINFRSGTLGGIIATEKVYVNSDETPVSPPPGSGTVNPYVVEVKLGLGSGVDWWVTQQTPIKLDCEDQIPHPVGQETMCYRISFDDPDTPWLTEQYCREFNQGGVMKDGWCCAYVGEPIFDDLIPKTVYTFHFMEDSVHDLEYYCKDHLGNTGKTDLEYFKVDSMPPTTNKKYIPDAYIDPKTGYEYIDTANLVELTATDHGDICHVDGVKTYYTVTQMKDEYCTDSELCKPIHTYEQDVWMTYEKPFPIKEESCHMIEYWSEDKLGNKEPIKAQCVFADHTKPVTTKTYEGPQFPIDGDKDGVTHWITSDTKVILKAEDSEPHPSGVKATYYKDIYLPEKDDWKYCYRTCNEWKPSDYEATDWTLYTGPFTKRPESCHVIEYYSVDNVGKKEDVRWQCVFVDNTPPEVTKTISDPKEKWAGDNTFYPGLTDRCWSTDSLKAIECWKVTLGNSLKITCTDPEPHPVDHNKMCFQIELDGTDPEDDRTEKYCNFFHGQLIDKWCCIENGIENFQFLEESQHDLKVKCVDALGNEGKIDEEKFKVEGCTWELCLKKKWNLISVPFTLFNDNPDEVFKDIKDDVVSIWTYDNGKWFVWQPTGGGTLEHVKPGWGYWVLAKEDACVEVAGSLFSPLEVPPSRDLQEGWNLIGYYGNTMMPRGLTIEVDGDGRCLIPSKPVYCALNSLVDTSGGFPRWGSLYNYFNYGDDVTGWIGLDACIDERWMPAFMDAGKGYWIEMDIKDGYAPATNCIWNEDFRCVMPFV